jgi:hypothetical protein
MSTLVIPENVERGVFERGDKIYMTTPVQVFEPTDSQIEEYAFAKHVRSAAPNENIVWLKGQYVEADNANANGAQWSAGELAIKSLTPVLMPVTVMHDPRTAVGTIAHAQLLTPEKDKVQRARIDTILALWAHRFPEAVTEALENAQSGRLMQSMECFSPWYECSECSQVFHKLPRGAEQANWCEHLKASNPSAGYVDLSKAAASGPGAQRTNASRILGDVCFTGTGLIYGSRGARGAYSEAHLNVWQEEVASFHRHIHDETASSVPVVVTANHTPGGSSKMGLVQIEESELATLRKERDDARAEAQKAATEKADAERAVTEAETKANTAEEAKKNAEKERDELKESQRQVAMRDKRMGELGDGFIAKLGDRTKESLRKTAETASDEAWNERLEEIEEIASVKRDAKKDGESGNDGDGNGTGTGKNEAASSKDGVFENEEIAAFVGSGAGSRPSNGSQAAPTSTRQVVGGLYDAFAGKGAKKD